MKIKQNRLKILLLFIGLILIVVGAYLFMPRLLKLAGMLISVFLPFILGYVFSRLVNPLADFLQKKLKCPRGVSALLVIIFTVGILGGILTAIVWKLVVEIRNLYGQFPAMYTEFQLFWKRFSENMSHIYNSMPDFVQNVLTDMSREISDKAKLFIDSHSRPMVGYASDFAKAIPGVFIGVIIFILSVYFMVVDSENVSVAVHKILGKKLSARLTAVKNEFKRYLGGYVHAQFIIMCVTFTVMFIEFSLGGINYAVLIALSTAFLDALPVFGSGIVLWPLAAINFFGGNIKAGVLMVVAFISVVVTRHIIEPKLVSSKIGMNPILTLMAMYIGFRIWGVGGIILGTILLLVIISLYKSGMFDSIIEFIKRCGRFVKSQWVLCKNFIKKLVEENDE